MRHRIYGKHLGRDKNERSALFKSLVQALFTHGSIDTSKTKAKATSGLIDKVINLAKDKKTQPRLQLFLTDKNLQERLIKEIVPKMGNKNSGYTSLVNLGTRPGDQAAMVRMSLIGAEELKSIEKGIVKKIEEKKEKIPEKKVTTKKPVKRASKRTAK